MNKVRFSVRTLLACLSLLCVGLSIRQMVAAGVVSVIAGYHFTCALVTMFVIVKELNEASGSGIREHLYVFGTTVYSIILAWSIKRIMRCLASRIWE